MIDPRRKLLDVVHRDLQACRACPNMVGPVVHGPPVFGRVMLLGQAPGPHEGKLGRPFAWTAGKTLFAWFESALGVDEETFRARVYMAAVARCFPGKAAGGGDRKPDRDEVSRCGSFLEREMAILRPELIIPVGSLAIEQVLGHRGRLVEVVGQTLRARYHGVDVDAIALPHPSGVSTWHRTETGKALLARALAQIGAHPAWADVTRAAP
jgi:uracil-DNA glycosylase